MLLHIYTAAGHEIGPIHGRSNYIQRLARRAQRELIGSRVVLRHDRDTRPEELRAFCALSSGQEDRLFALL